MMRLKEIPITERILEQKMIAVLSVLLLFFNDPLYAVTVLFPNKVSSYFSVLFVTNFIIFLLYTWIIFLEKIKFEGGLREINLIEWKRYAYFTITYVLVFVFYTLRSFDFISGFPIVPVKNLKGEKFLVL